MAFSSAAAVAIAASVPADPGRTNPNGATVAASGTVPVDGLNDYIDDHVHHIDDHIDDHVHHIDDHRVDYVHHRVDYVIDSLIDPLDSGPSDDLLVGSSPVPVATDSQPGRTRDAASRPGAYCSIGGCPSPPPSRLSDTAAFGAVIFGGAWFSRRRVQSNR
jgi:MYXO-CTERM domain-containing protein